MSEILTSAAIKAKATELGFAACGVASPEPLRTQLGALQFVLEVDLTPDRKLAQADPDVVRANLVSRGFHLQFPPTMPDPMSEDWGTDA